MSDHLATCFQWTQSLCYHGNRTLILSRVLFLLRIVSHILPVKEPMTKGHGHLSCRDSELSLWFTMWGRGVERNQISDIRTPKKSNIRYQTPNKNQIPDPLKNQISDTTPPKKSNIRYQGTPVPPPPPPAPPPPPICFVHLF